MKWLVWDFDGTLAYRIGEWPAWTQALLEVLDRETPGHGVDPELLRPFLRTGFPWHSPEVYRTRAARRRVGVSPVIVPQPTRVDTLPPWRRLRYSCNITGRGRITVLPPPH